MAPTLARLRHSSWLVGAILTANLTLGAQDGPNQPLTPMARDARPTFEVAVIKPSDPNDHDQGFRLKGRRIVIEACTMTSLISFAYSIHKSQIVNAPRWFDEQTWDIEEVPDIAGVPNWRQYRRMLQDLLAARFGLVLQHEKRELSVYAITVAKGGPKLEKTKSDPNAMSDQSGRGVGTAQSMKFTNYTMADFAENMQLMVDRPVVDQTNLPGHYDFALLWTPDAMRDTPTDTAPVLFTAITEQLGLKLVATKTPTDALVVNAVTRPTQN